MCSQLEVADRGVDLQRILIGITQAGVVRDDGVVLLPGLGIAFGIEELVGVRLSFSRYQRNAHRL